jgi:hypothetical protein
VNRKKLRRLRREEGLRVPQHKRKRQRLGESTVPAKRLGAERPNHVWAIDFQFDTTTDGRTLKLLHVVDEHTREALAIRAPARSTPTTTLPLEAALRRDGILCVDPRNAPPISSPDPKDNYLLALAHVMRLSEIAISSVRACSLSASSLRASSFRYFRLETTQGLGEQGQQVQRPRSDTTQLRFRRPRSLTAPTV